jgi:CRISPR-associated protein Cas2
MYLLIVYDVKGKKVTKVNNFLKSYLHWQQNSVFEGKVTLAQYKEIINELKKLINKKEDSIIIYKIPYKYLNKNVLGIEKNPITYII